MEKQNAANRNHKAEAAAKTQKAITLKGSPRITSRHANDTNTVEWRYSLKHTASATRMAIP
jgi:hypothetical protein